jgi:hypothetical protein
VHYFGAQVVDLRQPYLFAGVGAAASPLRVAESLAIATTFGKECLN